MSDKKNITPSMIKAWVKDKVKVKKTQSESELESPEQKEAAIQEELAIQEEAIQEEAPMEQETEVKLDPADILDEVDQDQVAEALKQYIDKELKGPRLKKRYLAAFILGLVSAIMVLNPSLSFKGEGVDVVVAETFARGVAEGEDPYLDMFDVLQESTDNMLIAIEAEERRTVDPNKPMIAITLDDGPGEHTQRLVELMEKYGVRFTFYMLGNRVKGEYKDLMNQIIDLGGEIGNHSYNHPDFRKLSEKKITYQVDTCDNRIKAQVGEGTRTIRLPYGASNDLVKETVGKPIIAWSVDTLDWKTKDKNSTLKAMTTNIKDGDIILGHDIHKPTVDAIVEAIPILLQQGFQIVTVSEMAEARGIELVPGEIYYHFRK